MKNIIHICLTCWLLAGSVLFAENTNSTLDDIIAHLTANGIEADVANKISDGFKKAIDEKSIEPVADLLNGDDQVAFVMVCLFALMDHENNLLLKALEEEDIKNPDILIYGFAFTNDKTVIDYLVERLQREKDNDVKQAIVSVLRIVCEQKISDDPSKWKKWWAKNKDILELPAEVDIEKRERAFKVECQHHRIRQIDGVLKKITAESGKQDKTTKKIMDGFGDMVQGIADIADAGEELQYSDSSKHAYQCWLKGDLSEAVKSFSHSVRDNPDDIYSRYMRGILLIETDRLEEAEAEFDEIIDVEKKCELAKFLKRFCRYHKGKQDTEILASISDAFKKTKIDEESMWGWNDKFIISFLGQASLSEGPHLINKGKLEDIGRTTKDPTKAVAVGLLLEKGHELTFLESLEEKHKDSVIYQTALLRLYIKQSDERNLDKILSKLKRLRELAPDNGFYQLLLAYYSDYEKANEEREDSSSPPLLEKQLAMVEEVVNTHEFNSYATTITTARINVLGEIGMPFADIGGFGDSGTIKYCVTYRSVARRIAARGKSKEHNSDTVVLAEMLIKLGDKIDLDNGFLINRLVAEGVRGLGRDMMIEQAEKSGIRTTAKKYEKLNKQAKKDRKKYSDNIDSWVALSMIPVPKIQKVIIEETLKDEMGFIKSLSDFK